MASANVLGLVNQLQNFEQCLTDLLMEMAAKIGSLTDSNIFLVIETQEGRKISGQRHLCQQYLQGALAPVGVDHLFDVDTSVSAMRQIGSFNRGVDASVDAVVASIGDSLGQNDTIEMGESLPREQNRKRSICENGSNATEPQAKVMRQTSLSDDPEVVFIKTECDIDQQSIACTQSRFKTPPCSRIDNEGLSSGDSAELPSHFPNGGNFEVAMSSISPENSTDLLEVVNSKLAMAKMDALKCISGENACSRGTVENRLSTSLCKDGIVCCLDVNQDAILASSLVKYKAFISQLRL